MVNNKDKIEKKSNSQILWNLKKKDTGKIYKDIPFNKLKEWILEGRVSPKDYVINKDINKWVKVSSIKEFTPFFSPTSLGSEVISSNDINFGWQSSSSLIEEDTELELTPMIDVTFLLLIFFMVTATFAIHEVKNIKVPKAKYTVKYKQEKLLISIDKEKKIYLGKQEVSLKDLKIRLMEEVSKTNQQDIILNADHRIDYGFIVAVLDEINGAGIKNVKLRLEKKKEK